MSGVKPRLKSIESRPVRACAEAPGSVRENTSLLANGSSDDSRFFHLANPVKTFWHVENVTSSPEGSGINKARFIGSEFCGEGSSAPQLIPCNLVNTKKIISFNYKSNLTNLHFGRGQLTSTRCLRNIWSVEIDTNITYMII